MSTCGPSTGTSSYTISMMDPVAAIAASASLEQRVLVGIADVDWEMSARLGEQHETGQTVVDIAEASGLRAVAEHSRRAAGERLMWLVWRTRGLARLRI